MSGDDTQLFQRKLLRISLLELGNRCSIHLSYGAVVWRQYQVTEEAASGLSVGQLAAAD